MPGRLSLDTGNSECSEEAAPVAEVHTLHMYLDHANDNVVEEIAGTYGDWHGGAQPGGILLVPLRTYPPAADVQERCELRFRWAGDDPETRPGWTATLTADHPARIRVYATRAKNAVPLDLAAGINLAPMPGEANTGRIRLWMEAADFPNAAIEAAWRVRVMLQYIPVGGVAIDESAELRIAPWIMASDLDPTTRVYAIGPALLQDYMVRLNDFVEAAGPAWQRINMQDGGKPFMRDVLKCGYAHAPHDQFLAVQAPLDDLSPYTPSVQSLQGLGAARFRRPVAIPDLSSQDNGGNLLVSPPVLPAYPLGRIIVGQNLPNYPCNSYDFYCNQMIQAPIVVDPTWLSVGHADEIVSFVPNGAGGDWPWRILLISPRLGIILAYAASAVNAPIDLDTLCDQADTVNTASRAANESWADLLQRCQDQWGAPVAVGGAGNGGAVRASLGAPGPYAADPPPPEGQDRKFVAWTAGGDYEVQSLDAYLAVPNHAAAFGVAQPLIDADRTALRTGLGGAAPLTDDHVIDVPVLLPGNVTETADSVNMLVLRNGGGTRCLVPKPFGPVWQNTYVFQHYLDRRLSALGLHVTFVNDWDYLHAHEGEVHCGTNQLHTLPAGNRAWWRHLA
jgi:protein-arginine deiminase